MFRQIIIYAIFFWQLVNKAANCFNNIVFIVVMKISSKKVCEKMETLQKVLLVCYWNTELLRSVGAIFNSKMAFLRRMRKKSWIILKSLQKKFAIFCFIYLSLLTFELSNINWKYSENSNMLTEQTYDSAVLKVLLNIITICIFIEL